MSALALRPVADTTRRARLYQIAQGPWPVPVEAITRPGGIVAILRAGGVTGYRGQVDRAIWSLPDVPREALPGHPAFHEPWPGRRAVVVAAACQDAGGVWTDTTSDEVMLLAAVWERQGDRVAAGLVSQEGRAVRVPPGRLWPWLHWGMDDALAALT